jgi:hypothetical protein
MSYAQSQRQQTRTAGRYARMNRCEVCERALGADYCSDGRTCEQGAGLVLCSRDAKKGLAMNANDARRFYTGTKP